MQLQHENVMKRILSFLTLLLAAAHVMAATNQPNILVISEFYTTDNFARAATNYVVQHRANHPASPFFMYLSFNGVHAPLEARPADLSNANVTAITNENR